MVAPAAANVVDCPMHIAGEFTVTTGKGFTITVLVTVFVQPVNVVVPVTVYDVVTVGFTIMELAVEAFDQM